MGEDARKIIASTDDVFAEAVRVAREKCGLTQLSLATKMSERGFDFHQQTVYKIERLDRKVTVSEAKAISEIVGVPLDVMLEEDSDSVDAAIRELVQHFGNYQRHLHAVYGLAMEAIPEQREIEQSVSRLREHEDMTESKKAQLEAVFYQFQIYADFTGPADYARAYEELGKAAHIRPTPSTPGKPKRHG